jgi:hypothetical protein
MLEAPSRVTRPGDRRLTTALDAGCCPDSFAKPAAPMGNGGEAAASAMPGKPPLAFSSGGAATVGRDMLTCVFGRESERDRKHCCSDAEDCWRLGSALAAMPGTLPLGLHLLFLLCWACTPEPFVGASLAVKNTLLFIVGDWLR